jgi:hypothetical protein
MVVTCLLETANQKQRIRAPLAAPIRMPQRPASKSDFAHPVTTDACLDLNVRERARTTSDALGAPYLLERVKHSTSAHNSLS